jgi:hypothetical protein
MNQPIVVRDRYAPAGLRLLLVVVAVVLFVIYALAAAGTITTAHSGAFLGWGLVAFAASFL